MLGVQVVLTARAAREVDSLPPVIHDRVHRVLARLMAWPEVSGARSLRGPLAGQFRMRTGDYRVQFRVVGDQITVTRVGHRDGFYED